MYRDHNWKQFEIEIQIDIDRIWNRYRNLINEIDIDTNIQIEINIHSYWMIDMET